MGVSFRSAYVPHVFEDIFGRPSVFQADSSCGGDLMKRLSLLFALLASLLLLPSPSWSQGMPSGARSSVNAEIVVQVRNPDGTAASTGIHLRLEVGEALPSSTARRTGRDDADLCRAAQENIPFG